MRSGRLLALVVVVCLLFSAGNVHVQTKKAVKDLGPFAAPTGDNEQTSGSRCAAMVKCS